MRGRANGSSQHLVLECAHHLVPCLFVAARVQAARRLGPGVCIVAGRAVCLALAVSCAALVAAAAPAAQSTAADVRVDYLVSLGRLWATVKYFHPAIDEGRPEVWDDAALTAIPRVLEARSPEDFVEAARAMVGTLGDPVTRIERAMPAAAPVPPWGFARLEHRGGVLVVTSGPVPATRWTPLRRWRPH